MRISGWVKIPFDSYEKSVPELLDAMGAGEVLTAEKQVLVKPNLVNDSPPPVTTPVECCEAVVRYVRGHSRASVVIAEGCGSSVCETVEVFEKLGYRELSERLDVPLVDLNLSPTVKAARQNCRLLPFMHLPELAFESFILSVPVLKAHSLAGITGTMKNMMGFLPPSRYGGGGGWKKSAFHKNIHQSIIELNSYVSPDLTVLDARIGLAEYHLGGAPCEPPAGVLLGGWDPVETDREAAELLGTDWRELPHLVQSGSTR